MTKSNKILCIVGAILIAFVGLFGIVFATQNDRVVKADTVDYSFVGSPLYFPLTVRSTGSNFDNIYFGLLSYDFYGDANTIYLRVNSKVYLNAATTLVLNNGNYITLTRDNDWHSYDNLYYYKDGTAQMLRVKSFWYYCNPSFDFNPKQVTIGVDTNGKISYSFLDVNGNSFNLDMYGSGDINYFWSDFNSRVYFLDSNITDNQYYLIGKQDGLNENQQNIFDEGYQKAIDENKQNWINYGKQQGIAQANDYTFFGVIGATIDAPISALFGRLDTNPDSPTYNQYVGGFFNFELLGVNLRSFFFAILTFALIIVIIRFALAR